MTNIPEEKTSKMKNNCFSEKLEGMESKTASNHIKTLIHHIFQSYDTQYLTDVTFKVYNPCVL